jgi:predicted transcriptional regulator
MAATTTIRLAPELRARLQTLSEQTERSAHSLIVEAVERYADYEEQLQALVRDAIAADASIEAMGEVYRAEDVRVWMERLAESLDAARPKPWRP